MKRRVSSLAEIFSFAVTLHSKTRSGMALRRQPRELRKFANFADTVISRGKMETGFSLIELLIVVALLGLVMVGVSQLLASLLSGTTKATASQQVKENGQFALGTMERTVRRARRVTTCSGSTLTVDVPDAVGTIATYTFQQSGSQLTQRINTGSAVALVSTPDVAVDSFSCTLTAGTVNNPSIVKLELNLSKSATGATDLRILSQRFETTVSLRTYY